ncbi:MAG: biotin/lipoyl-binding protein, partial [Candidatus Lokiarchaeota archaeon]|nr:biotin/lipoyl-binding protein [Candidatus Lokiarchaeota archaeon]
MNKKKTILISAIVLLVGGVVTTLIFLTEPTATRVTATKETAMLVDVKEVRQGAYQPIIVATGTVQPAKEIILRPRVGGMIVQLSSSFTPGGYVKKGQKLLQIEPADYRNELKLRNSELEQAQADLNIEMGRQDVAEKDYQLLDKNLTDENKDLVLRKPQLNAVRSR